MEVTHGFNDSVIIKNTEKEVRIVDIRYYNNMPRFSTNVFELSMYSGDDMIMYANDYVSDTYDVDLFSQYPNKSFNEFVEDICSDSYEFLEIMGDVEAYKEGDMLEAFICTGAGQMFDEDNPFTKVRDKYHLEKVDSFPSEILEVIDRVKKEVNQEPMWEQKGFELF